MTPCLYCGSRCLDQRGNCGSCGAPLPVDPDQWYLKLEGWSTSRLMSRDSARIHLGISDESAEKMYRMTFEVEKTA